MKIINFETLKEKIREYEKNSKTHYELLPIDETIKKDKLTELYKFEKNYQSVGLFKIKTLDDIIVLEYELIDPIKCSKTENIVIMKDNKPVFSMARDESSNEDIPYKNEKFSIYDEEFNILSEFHILHIINTSRVKVSNKIRTDDTSISKKYDFYINGNDIFAFRVDEGTIYMKTNNGFTIGLESANRLIETVCHKIDNRLDELLGIEKVKEYQIKRHNQG